MNKEQTYKIAALYRFTPLENIPALRKAIYDFGENCAGLCGTILLAPEGINGTIGAHPDALDEMIEFLDKKFGIKQGELKYSRATLTPFNRFKVRPKKELITLRKPEADPNKLVGEYVEPEKWNDLINDPDVLLVDTRNDYETKVGVFEGAVDPDMKIFTEFPDWVEKNLDPAKHKKVAMFCTGGIRCEKSTAYLKQQGFDEVYHLKGGILKYLEEVPEHKSKWQGECFVFDNRVTVNHQLEKGHYDQCHACRRPITEEQKQHEHYIAGVSCEYCYSSTSDIQRQRFQEREKQIQLAKQRGENHIGDAAKAARDSRKQEKLDYKNRQKSM